MSSLPLFDMSSNNSGPAEYFDIGEPELPRTIDPSLLSLTCASLPAQAWTYQLISSYNPYMISPHVTQYLHLGYSIPLYDLSTVPMDNLGGPCYPPQLELPLNWNDPSYQRPSPYCSVPAPTCELVGALGGMENVHSSPFCSDTPSQLLPSTSEESFEQEKSYSPADVSHVETYSNVSGYKATPRRSTRARKSLNASTPTSFSASYTPSSAGSKRSYRDYEADFESLDDETSGSEYANGSSSGEGDDDSERLASSLGRSRTTKPLAGSRTSNSTLKGGSSGASLGHGGNASPSSTLPPGSLVCGWPIQYRGKNSQMTKKGLAPPEIDAVCPMVCVSTTDLQRHRATDWHSNVKWYCPHCSRPLCVREDAIRRHLRSCKRNPRSPNPNMASNAETYDMCRGLVGPCGFPPTAETMKKGYHTAFTDFKKQHRREESPTRSSPTRWKKPRRA